VRSPQPSPPSLAEELSPEPRGPGSNRRYVPWADLLRRVFALQALACPRCEGPMTVLAYITERQVLEKILSHLGLPTSAPPLAPARRLDNEAAEFDFAKTPKQRSNPSRQAQARSPPDEEQEVWGEDSATDDDGFWGA